MGTFPIVKREDWTKRIIREEAAITTQAKDALSFSAEFWFVPPEIARDARITGLQWS